ncbi:MAG: cation diffusion facilitator family transporter [Victivallaceae bacterium]|nr:cation diffusion facilitator family transporter [Victivallaceae bacterium]
MNVHELNTENRKAIARLEGWLSIFGNILLFGFKFWVGVRTASLAIIADAWHSLSDSLTSVILLFGLKMADKPADREHPFGHGRAELITSVVIGILLAMVAFEFLWKSFERLQQRQGAAYDSLALWAMIITIVVKEAMAQYAFWTGKITGMTALKADAWHHRTDAISSVIILIGIVFGRNAWWLDSALGIMVAVIIMYAAFGILKSAISPLLGRPPGEELIANVKKVCEKYSGGEIYVHHFHIHDYGNHTELTFHIHLDGEMPLKAAHAITRQIEGELFREFAIEATIHMEPNQT